MGASADLRGDLLPVVGRNEVQGLISVAWDIVGIDESRRELGIRVQGGGWLGDLRAAVVELREHDGVVLSVYAVGPKRTGSNRDTRVPGVVRTPARAPIRRTSFARVHLPVPVTPSLVGRLGHGTVDFPPRAR